MEELISKQNALIEQFNTIKRNFDKTPVARRTRGYLTKRATALDEFWSEFKEADQELRQCKSIELSSYSKDKIYDQQDEAYFSFYADITDSLDALNNTIPPVLQQQPPQLPQPQSHASAFRLPHITLPVFSGDYATWTTFSDMFVTLIHDNANLTNVQKLHYLKSNLRGPAEHLLRHTTITNDNYNTAWETLKKRFQNKKALVDAQLKILFNQPSHITENAKDVRELIDTSTETLNALKGLEIDVSNWDPIMLFILIQKLSKDTHTAWEVSQQGNNDLPAFDEFVVFLENRFRMLESLCDRPLSTSNTSSKSIPNRNIKSHATLSSTTNPSTTTICPICSGHHYIRICPTFIQMDTTARRNAAKQYRVCFNCLVRGHSLSDCRNRMNCQKCNKRHHTLLHDYDQSTPPTSTTASVVQSAEPIPSTSSDVSVQRTSHIAAWSTRAPDVLLATAMITAVSSTGQLYPLRALIDQGSQVSFVTERAAQLLRLTSKQIDTSVTGIGNTNAGRLRHLIHVEIRSPLAQNFSITTNALILKSITGILPPIRCTPGNWPHLSNLALADPQFTTPREIDFLLGADVYADIIQPGLLKGSRGSPMAQSTVFGWIISGQVDTQPDERYNDLQTHITTLHSCIQIDSRLRAFWEIEEVNNREPFLTQEEQECEEYFCRTHHRNADGRYVVRLPLKSTGQLGESRKSAHRRLMQLERRLETNPQLKTSYTEFMREYIDLGHMKPYVESSNVACNFIPHHAVFKDNSSTTKVRVVFDASNKSTNGVSLNDLMLVGPTIQDDLSTILLRWRKYPIAYTADVEKMYRQVQIHPSDQHLQHILWRESPELPIIDYALLTITYGTSCAPHLAVRTLKQLAIDEEPRYPIASKITQEDFYVDDLMSGSYSSIEALTTRAQVSELLASGGLKLRKWVSNHAPLLEQVPAQDREIPQSLNIGIHNTITALGIHWIPSLDQFTFKVNLPPISCPATKRIILSDVSKLFDPLGWLAPIIIRSKIIMQQLWVKGVQWDDSLHESITNDWETLRNDLFNVNNITINRWMYHHNNSIELHGFSDASIHAYAAVVYARITQPDGQYRTSLLSAKTRVAPLKQLSIPRLELCGATLLSELLVKISKNIKIQDIKIHAWTDSTIVLHWIRSQPNRWKTFVANRVSTIQQKIPIASWSHVPTADNPADCASRGLDARSLKDFDLWWEGPKWLKEECSTWPILHSKLQDDQDIQEHKIVSTLAKSTPSESTSLLESFSSLGRLLRVTAYCRRFITRCRKIHTNFTETLSADELSESMKCWIHVSQENAFEPDINRLLKRNPLSPRSHLLSLSPFIDKDGLLRVGGRLQNSKLSYNEKHPIILSHKCHLTTLIIRLRHLESLHGGPQLVMGLLRKNYWVTNARNTVRLHIYRCITCHRFKAESSTQLMGSLPEPRVNITRAFTHTGVDYAGPIDLRMSKGRGNASYKGYISLFVCLCTKAIHIEAVSDLTSNAFIAAYRRFVSRRGLPSHMYSDNGTNFVGAVKSLRKSQENCLLRVKSEIVDNATKQHTEWHFIPASSPHFGGLWEAGVKSLKFHLKRSIGNTRLTYEELTTLLTQIEACLNSRPLAPLTTDLNDTTALTPGHFLIGDALLALPDHSIINEKISILSRWQLVQQLHQNIILRWKSEYLTRLQNRPKWTNIKPNFEIGDLVLIKESNISPASWPLARVIELHPGTDGLVRVVTVRTPNSTLKRSITKLCPLPK